MIGKGILIVLDAVGIGGAPDAKKFGDQGADTLGNIRKACVKGEANLKRFVFFWCLLLFLGVDLADDFAPHSVLFLFRSGFLFIEPAERYTASPRFGN